MNISIITLFPDMFSGPFNSSIIKRALDHAIVAIHLIQLRDFTDDAYHTVDDHPYGGGTGMILKVDVMDRAIRHARAQASGKSRVILLDPQGTTYTQKAARTLSRIGHIILVCGRYEGFDERIRGLVDEEISVGDYVLTGGELPAMTVIDSVVRLLPGVLRKEDATENESFEHGLLEHPQYTRPETYTGVRVPDILLSGNHARIRTWQAEEARKRTVLRRPDLIEQTDQT